MGKRIARLENFQDLIIRSTSSVGNLLNYAIEKLSDSDLADPIKVQTVCRDTCPINKLTNTFSSSMILIS